MESPPGVVGQIDLDSFYPIIRSWQSKHAKTKPVAKKPVEAEQETYVVRSLEELKALADKELNETGNPLGPAGVEYMEMLEQQRSMNPEADLGELDTVSELWQPETSPAEVAHAEQEEHEAEVEMSEEAKKKKKKPSKKDTEKEEEEQEKVEVVGKKRKKKSAGTQQGAAKTKKPKKLRKLKNLSWMQASFLRSHQRHRKRRTRPTLCAAAYISISWPRVHFTF